MNPVPVWPKSTGLRGVEILGPALPGFDEILTPQALAFVAHLERRFRATRKRLLAKRAAQQARFDAGELPGFPVETRAIREGAWRVTPAPADLQKRQVEITGPVDRKMIINALNAGTDVFMADFEDSTSPTWGNVIRGQINLRDAVRRTIDYVNPETGKEYRLNDEVATLVVRPRGLHLPEKHVRIDRQPVSAAIFDFALYYFHNAHELLRRGTGPYFYLPKLESYLEARFWDDVFVAAQYQLGVPQGSIRATVLIETLPAAFQMDEILYELRHHSAGLNCGRWDYIFSFIKKMRSRKDCVLPDRGLVTMSAPFLHAYSQLLIQVCHRRGAHAMGGMAAQIPIKDDPERNAEAIAKVRADKAREAGDGHDGTWVAHPGLVEVAREEFALRIPGANQIARTRDDVSITARELLRVPQGPITEAGLRQNVDVGIRYLEAWLGGNGCVPIYDLMEDAATAEISRTQVWQWIRHRARLEDGRKVDRDLVREILTQVLASIRTARNGSVAPSGALEQAGQLFEELVTQPKLAEFLTLPAYDRILSIPSKD